MLEQNRGVGHERVKYKFINKRINPELVFQQEWDKINRNRPEINHGIGIAQRLLIVPEQMAHKFNGPNRDDIEMYSDLLKKEICIYKLTLREQKIIASIIQWLGTNCGFGFLMTCLERCGYNIDYIPEKKTDTDPKPVSNNRYGILKNAT